MCLATKLRELIDAGFSGLWVQTQEPDEAIAEIRQLATQESYRIHGQRDDGTLATEPGPEFDPFATLTGFASFDVDSPTLLILPNFGAYLSDPTIRQMVYRAVQTGKKARRYIVILAPTIALPAELEKVFVTIDHDMPDRQQLREIAESIGTEPGEVPEGEDLERLLDAASGLTRYEAEGAFSLSIVRLGKIDPAAVWELKSGALKKSGTLQLHRGNERFSDLGGLSALKDFATRCLRPGKTVRPKGLMLLGVPGTGKSAFSKALGNETGRPTISLDMGALMGSLVGQTEAATRQALKVIDAMAPAILFVDEIEKGLAGAGTESTGVTTRMFGTFLTWLNDHTSDVFTICTSNDISKLPPEFTRAGRFDAVFFLDLPTAAQREAIWNIHQTRYGVTEQDRPDTENWTGAEIESCCRLCALLDEPLTEAAIDVVPVAVTAADRVEGLRQWASGRVLDADRKGIYHRTRQQTPPVETGRRTLKRKTDLE